MKKLILLFLILTLNADASLLYKLDKGIKLYNSGNYKAAINYLDKYIQSNPNDENGYFWLGKSYEKTKNIKQAYIAYNGAYNLAQNEKNIEKIEFENNEYDNLEDHFDIAASYFEEGNYKQSLNYANMMLKIDPDSASAYFIKAKIAHIEGKTQEAEEYLKKAIFLNNALLKTKLANILGIDKLPELPKQEYIKYAQKSYYRGDIASCIRYLKKYIESDNTNIDVYIMLIDCYLKNNSINEAKETVSEAKRISESNLSLLAISADILRYESEEKYENELKKAYEINPNNKNILLKLGNFYLDNKNYPEAKKYFETLVSVNDSLYEAYFGYIYSSIKTGDIENIENQIRKISALAQNNSEIFYLLSMLCETKGSYKEALEYILDAIKKDDNPYYYLEAGKISYILGDYEASINYLSSLNDEKAKEYLLLNYIKTNNIQKMKEMYYSNNTLDKKRIMYKYYLYKISKLESNIELNSILKQKPNTLDDYIDLARINFLENKEENAYKILNNASKKFKDSYEIKEVEQELKYQK